MFSLLGPPLLPAPSFPCSSGKRTRFEKNYVVAVESSRCSLVPRPSIKAFRWGKLFPFLVATDGCFLCAQNKSRGTEIKGKTKTKPGSNHKNKKKLESLTEMKKKSVCRFVFCFFSLLKKKTTKHKQQQNNKSLRPFLFSFSTVRLFFVRFTLVRVCKCPCFFSYLHCLRSKYESVRSA